MKWIVRILGSLLLLVVLAVAILFALGRRPGAGVTHSEVTIDRPVAEVWTWLTDPVKVKQWVGWLTEIRTTETGPPRVGMRETWVMDDPNMKQKIELNATITQVETNQRLAVEVSFPGSFEGTSTFELTDLGGKTRLEANGRYRYLDPLAALMEPLVTPEAARKERADFAHLKSLAEAAPRGSATEAAVDSATTP